MQVSLLMKSSNPRPIYSSSTGWTARAAVQPAEPARWRGVSGATGQSGLAAPSCLRRASKSP